MNRIQLTGRLAQEPREGEGKSGKAICELRLAVPRPRARGGHERGAVFVDVTCFEALAQVCARHLAKGRLVAVSGRLEQRQWEGADGQRRQRHYVVADEVEFLDPRAVGVEPVAG